MKNFRKSEIWVDFSGYQLNSNLKSWMIVILLLLTLINKGFSQNDSFQASAYELEMFKGIAIEKADYFYVLLNRIASKSTSRDSLKYYLNEADLLFHDSAIMQIELKNGRVKDRPIMDYLNRLSRLNYTELKIKVFSAYFVSDLKYVSTQRVGNNTVTEYEGVIAFKQLFEGKRGGEIVYSDKTTKALRVHVLITQSDTGRSFDVLLGDIQVLQIS